MPIPNCFLSIIVVNWNSGSQLKVCIASIDQAEKQGFVLSEVVVVDNASTDQSLEGLDQSGAKVRVIRNTENVGFAAACNQGAAVSSGDYLLFLNPDTRLFGDSLIKPVDFMQQPENASIGICGIRLLDESGSTSTSAARFPTLRVMAGRILGLSKLAPSMFPAHLLSSAELQESDFVDQVIGAFFLIRRELFVRCHGFDERFFVYFEEVDLSLKAYQLGYRSYFLSEVSAFHKGGGCSERVKKSRLFYSIRSRILYARKHYIASEFIALVLLTWIEFPLRLMQGAMRGSLSDMKNTLFAYWKLLTYFFWRI